MLSRSSAIVHPLGRSTSTDSDVAKLKDKAADYTSLPSPSPSPRYQIKSKLLYNYPRLNFMLLFICCTYIGGIYVSTKFTTWTLHVLGVHNDLTTAREVYAVTSHKLNTMSQCVERSSLEFLASAKLQYEADSKRVQEVVNANDEILIKQRNATITRTTAFLSTLNKQIQPTASNEANSTLKCFVDSFYKNMPNDDGLSSSRALILAVRALLTTQVAMEANNSASKQTNQFENQLLDMWNSIDSVKISIEKTIAATNAVAVEQLNSLALILPESDGSGLTQQSASRLGRLSNRVSSELSDPLTSTSTHSLEAVQKAGRTLHKALEFVAGLHGGVMNVLDTVDETWKLLENQLNTSVEMVSQLQKELAYVAKATAQQVKNTSTVVLTSLEQAQQEVSTSFNLLRDRWHDTVQTLVAEGLKPWQRLGDQLIAELTANQRQSVRPENSIQRRYLLPDRTTNSSLTKAHAKLAVDSHTEGSTRGEFKSSNDDDKFDIDTAVLRASLVDIGAFVTQVLFYVDIGRLALLIADLAVGLITESYSDMPVLDIRGLAAVETIGSVSEVLCCHHSVSAVWFTLVTNATELLRVLVTFLLLVVVASVITAGLYLWKKDHRGHCLSHEASATSQTTIQSITRAFVENKSNTSKRVINPLEVIQKYRTIANDSIQNDYATLTFDSTLVWKNQSLSLDDLDDCAKTTSRLVRMLQDCTTSRTEMLVDDALLSSQSLTTSLNNNRALVNLLPFTEELRENAPFLEPSTVFKRCFPTMEDGKREELVGQLQHTLACATEKAVYLSFASWWLLVVIFVANRFVVRMIIKSAGMYWWRYLSANRLQLVGFCQESGEIVAKDKLPKAIQQHLLHAKWLLVSRFVGIGVALASVTTIAGFIFHGIT